LFLCLQLRHLAQRQYMRSLNGQFDGFSVWFVFQKEQTERSCDQMPVVTSVLKGFDNHCLTFYQFGWLYNMYCECWRVNIY